jgi:pimeloyl-ACP methyl ester carboxylesterase
LCFSALIAPRSANPGCENNIYEQQQDMAMREPAKRVATGTLLVTPLLMACLGYAPAQQPDGAARVRPAAGVGSLEGEWAGTLQVAETELHLVLHLSKEGGEWHAKLDSLNQAAYGIEASKITRAADFLTLELASVGAKFSGKIAPDHRSIRGLWEQGGAALPLRFEKRASGSQARLAAHAISKVEGTWQGAIETGNMRMRLQLHIAHDEKGKLIASLDSLDQAIQGIPASRVAESGGQLHMEILAFNAEYNGTISGDKNEIKGEWKQNENDEDLNFRRSDKVLQVRRPQNPVKPYPYRSEDVSFASSDATATLAGTLTLPQGAGPFPAAVLVGGSGPMDRDETIAEHKPFLVLADFLTRRGLAVLRCDKRGIGQSTGNFASAAVTDLARDTQAALAYLKTRKEVDPQRLGVIGHSEGGILASFAATQASDANWVVLMAAPATTGERTLLRQSELLARGAGLPEEQITQSLDFNRKAYAAVRSEPDPASLTKRLQTLVEQSGLAAAVPPAALQAQLRMMTSPWFREFLDYDPLPTLEKLQCPVLALAGDRDLQVDSLENVPLLRKAYETSGNKDFTVVEMEGVNHLLQKAQSGMPALYGAIEETMAPEVLESVASWITDHVTKK